MQVMRSGEHLGKIVIDFADSMDIPSEKSARKKLSLPTHASYILVGGLGGLGRAIAIWMAEGGATESQYIYPFALRGVTDVTVSCSHFSVQICRRRVHRRIFTGAGGSGM